MYPIHSIKRRLVAFSLLLSLFLQSCGNESIQLITPRPDKSVTTASSPSKTKVESNEEPIDSLLSVVPQSIISSSLLIDNEFENSKDQLISELSIDPIILQSNTTTDSVLNQPIVKNEGHAMNSFVQQQPVSIDKLLPSNQSAIIKKNPILIDKRLKTSQELVKASGKVEEQEGATYGKEPLASAEINLATSEETVSVHSIDMLADKVFTAKGGHQVSLDFIEGELTAIVNEQLVIGFTRASLSLPVYIEPGFKVVDLDKYPSAWQQAHIEVVFPERADNGKGYVYIGRRGGLGGGNSGSSDRGGNDRSSSSKSNDRCTFRPNEKRPDPDNPGKYVCPGNGKHHREAPTSSSTSSNRSANSSKNWTSKTSNDNDDSDDDFYSPRSTRDWDSEPSKSSSRDTYSQEEEENITPEQAERMINELNQGLEENLKEVRAISERKKAERGEQLKNKQKEKERMKKQLQALREQFEEMQKKEEEEMKAYEESRKKRQREAEEEIRKLEEEAKRIIEEPRRKAEEEALRHSEAFREQLEARLEAMRQRRTAESIRREEEAKKKEEENKKKAEEDKKNAEEEALKKKEEEAKKKAEEEARKKEERTEKVRTNATLALEAVMHDTRAYLQVLEEGILLPAEQKEQGQRLLKQMAELKAKEEASYKRVHDVYVSENSPEGDKLLTEELVVIEVRLEKVQEIRGQLLAVLDLTIEELKGCGIERDSSKGLILGISTIPLVDTENLPTEEQLEEQMTNYLDKYEKDTVFKKLLEAYNIAITKLEAAPNNSILQANKASIEAQLQGYELYKEGVKLAITADYICQAAEDEADRMYINSVEGQGRYSASAKDIAGISQLRGKAAQIKSHVLLPFRNIFKCPNSPRGDRKVLSALKGAAKSLEDTGKGVLVIASLPVLLLKLGYDSVESLAKWEDKLGIEGKYISAKEAIKVLFKETKYEWENPEEYRKRQQTVRAYKKQMLAYNRVFNAERYHCKQAEELGYATMEALQFVFGEEIIKVVSEASKAGKGAKVTERIKEVEEVMQGLRASEQASRVAEALENILKPGGKLVGEQAGKNSAIRTVTKEEAKKIIKKLMKTGAKKVENPRYPATWYELPEGQGFGIRIKPSSKSKQYGTKNTIDLKIDSLKSELEKIKF